MKIALCSDLHLEFGTISLENSEGAEVLILSGDICIANDLLKNDEDNFMEDDRAQTRSRKFHKFFQECCDRFENVVYISGNHEHYHGDFGLTTERLRSNLGYLPNLHILDNQSVTFGDITFIGGTLWTDMNKEDPQTLYAIKRAMNDFHNILDSRVPVTFRDESGKFHEHIGKLLPTSVVESHKEMLKYIDESTVDATVRYVVVGHHSPSKQSTKPQYERDVIINGAYSSDLSEFILDRPQIKLWTHGHTHHEFDYMIGSTRIVCNPRGYIGYEGHADDFKLKFIEV